MSVPRRLLAAGSTLLCALAATAAVAPQAQAIEIKTKALNINASAPILGEATNGLQSLLSGLVSATTQATCDLSGNNETVCTLKVLSYGIATDYKKPNGQHVVKVTGGIVNIPTLVDATGDGLPDVAVQIQALGTSDMKMYITKQLTAPANFPVSVEALVTDPSTDNRIINVGYDARATTAPKEWNAQASLTTGTTTTVKATLGVKTPPSSMAVIGGLYTQGPNNTRTNPKQARLNFTPVPGSANIEFSLNPAYTTGTISAATQTKADLEMLLLDGQTGQHVTGTLDQLRKPLSLLLNKVDGAGNQTDGTTGNQHVGLTTQKDVNAAGLVYEGIENANTMQRVRVNTTALPGQTDFTQTPNGLLIDTSEPIAKVSGGVSAGHKPEVGDPQLVPVPANAPVESAEASYVHQDTTNKVDSTTFRVAGVQHVSVETTGPQDDRKIAIGARLTAAPLHALVTNDGGSRYDAQVNNLPHNFSIAIALKRKRMLDFCGSSSDAADPCSAAGQLAPAGIGEIVLADSYGPEPLFGRATHINGKVTGLPSTLGLDVETHAPENDADPDQNTKVHIDATRAIGRTILRATDGTPAPADPVDNGIVYTDTPAKYAVVAKVDGFRRAHLDTDPKLNLDLQAESGHDFSYKIDLPAPDEMHITGGITSRPYRTLVSLFSPENAPMQLDISGETFAGTGATTPALTLNLDQPKPLFSDATHLEAAITSIQPETGLTIDSRGPADDADPDQNTKVHVDASKTIGQVIIRASDGGALPADPVDNGVVYLDQPGQPFAIIAKVDGFKKVHLDTDPKLDVTLEAAAHHDLQYGIHLPPEDGKPAKDFQGVMEDRPAITKFSFANPDAGPMTVHAEGRTADDDPAPTGRISLEALHLDDDPAEKIHNVKVDLTGVPPTLDLVKHPTAVEDAIDIDVTTDGGNVGSADVQLDNDQLPDPASVPAFDNGNGVVVFTGAPMFFVHAHVQQLRGVSLTTAPQLDATLDVAVPQDFRIYLNTGVGADNRINVNGCDDWEADHHTKPHVEYHDVHIKQLQPNTQFKFTTGDDGNADPCERKSWRVIEYQADGRADSISYDTTVGDMSHLRTVIGQEGDNPLKVPSHLEVCQAGDDTCFDRIGRHKQCTVLGVDYDYCSLYSADTSVYLEAFGEKTHVSLNFCSLNADENNFSSCTRPGVTSGVFVDLNFAHMDMGYAYDTGFGFLTTNTQQHELDGHTDIGPNQGATGFVRAIDHNSIAEYINLHFGWDQDAGLPKWEATPTKMDNSYGIITFAAPLVGSHDGDSDCQEPAYGPTWDDTDSYFHVILDTAGNDENWLGDNLTNLLCGLF